LDKILSQKHVVVAQKDSVGTHLRLADKKHPFLDKLLSSTVSRMRLPRDDKLHRMLGIAQDSQQPLRVVQ
jgi:hypothetical protein